MSKKKSRKKDRSKAKFYRCLALQLELLAKSIKDLGAIVEEVMHPRVEESIKRMVLKEDE